MVGPDGLLCAPLELHGRTFAGGKPAIPPYRLVLVVKPTPRWFELSLLTIIKSPPQGRTFYYGGPRWTRTNDQTVMSGLL